MSQVNDHLVLLCGFSAAGKSRSLKNLRDPAGVLYLNCEAGKKLPFKAQFKELTVTDPLQIQEAFDWAETKPHIHTIIIDSVTYLMEMFESLYIYRNANTQGAWNDFQQYFKEVMQQKVASSSKKVLFIAHVKEVYNDKLMRMDTKVPVKGALQNNGIESYFSIVIGAKVMEVKDLANYKNSLLNITPKEADLGIKYVYQTKLTKETIGERLRGPDDLFSDQETYIDNDIQLVFDRLNEYYS
jgi:hypothetical protein